jgi:hypothetical protein
MKSFGYAAASKSAPLAPWSFDRREPNPDDVVWAAVKTPSPAASISAHSPGLGLIC